MDPDAFAAGAWPIVAFDGVVVSVEDVTEDEGDPKYLDLMQKDGRCRTFLTLGHEGYFAPSVRVIVRFVEYGRRFANGTRYSCVVEM